MITFGPQDRFYLYREPTDMRKSFGSLCGLVRSGLDRDPLSGEVFVFINRRRTHIKLLTWDRSGFVLYYKRLERGTFERPLLAGASLSWHQLVLMMEGITVERTRRRKRYKR